MSKVKLFRKEAEQLDFLTEKKKESASCLPIPSNLQLFYLSAKEKDTHRIFRTNGLLQILTCHFLSFTSVCFLILLELHMKMNKHRGLRN